MKSDLLKELYRKSFHLFILIIPASYHILGKWESVKIFSLFAFIIVSIDMVRQKYPKCNKIFVTLFKKILREKEIDGEFCGTSYVAVSACLCFALFKGEFAVTAFIILTISDSMAAIFGKSIASKEFFEKSTAGSMAFFISAILVLISCGIFYEAALWFYLLGIFAVFIVTMFEARPSFLNIDDNLVIPVGFCIVMTLFDVILNYNF